MCGASVRPAPREGCAAPGLLLSRPPAPRRPVRSLERRSVVRAQPRRDLEAHSAQQLLEVSRPRNRHGDVADRVLDDQVPADDPRDELAERRIRVGVGRSRHRDHRSELRVAQRGEAAGDAGEDERQDQRRPRADVIGASGRCRADGREQTRADDGADAERRELHRTERARETLGAVLGLSDQLIERLDAKNVSHGCGGVTLAVLSHRPHWLGSPGTTSDQARRFSQAS